MGRYVFKLPDIGEGIAEAEIVAWHVKIGDQVAEDGRLADMMTDKATVEMESPVSGKVIEVAGEVGEIVAIGAPLVVIETPEADSAGKPAAPRQSAEELDPVASGTAARAGRDRAPKSALLAPSPRESQSAEHREQGGELKPDRPPPGDGLLPHKSQLLYMMQKATW